MLLCSWDFSRQEYWSGFLFPPPGDLPESGIKPKSPVSPALAGGFFTTEPPWEAQNLYEKDQKQNRQIDSIAKEM